MKIQIKKLDPSAILPTRNKVGDAGYDLYALEDGVLELGKRKLFKTGIAISIPNGFYGRIAPRSGLALKYGIDVLGGVVDSVYRGDIGVILVTADMNGLRIRKGERIAQLIIEKYHDIEWEEVAELVSSDRGSDGFGSSG